MKRAAANTAGFTLIEMMISVVVLAMITVYMTGLLVQQSRGYEIVEDVSDAQQAERAVGDLLERDVLATGMLVRAAGVVSGFDNVGPEATDVLCVTDPDAVLDPTSAGEGLFGVRVTAGYAGTGVDTLALAAPTLEQRDDPFAAAIPTYDNSFPADNVADSDFLYAPGTPQTGGVIVVDSSNSASGSQCGLIVNVANGPTRVTVDWRVTVDGTQLVGAPASLPSPPGSTFVAIPAHIYYVRPARPAVGALPAQAPQLVRDGMLLADDVEDLQVAYFHDADRDGACDANEWSGGDCPNAGVQGFNAYQPRNTDNCFLRAVRFNFVVRTANQDATVAADPTTASNAFIQTENAPARAGLDGFRRRVFSRTVLPRNSPVNAGSSPRGCS
jgi:prepilin-type N-terminal cleavage/methylation domain-containing protein